MSVELKNLSEREVLRRARQGDPAAFEFLYRRHNQRVYALCLRMVKNPAYAEDLTQDTFVAVLRGIREFRGQSAFSTWLHRVTRNTVLMGFRKRRVKETSLDEITDPEVDSGHPPAEFGVSDARLEGIADRMLLQEAVGQLSRGFRATLLLHDVHGYEHSEVAAMMGCATGTSKSQLHKARLRVRKMLNKCMSRNMGKSGRSSPAFRGATETAPESSPRAEVPAWCVPLEADR
jgi:RNA polymerase sigma-70 factor (ECF subfamily)